MTIDQMILNGQKRIARGLVPDHPSTDDLRNAWNIFLENARSSVPGEVRQYLMFPEGFDFGTAGMPPMYLSEFNDFRIHYVGLSEIKVVFPVSGAKVQYLVSNFEGRNTKPNWNNAQSFYDVELALGEAKNQCEIWRTGNRNRN